MSFPREALANHSFELEIAPLYPLLHPVLFETQHLASLIHNESFLLAVIVAIAARYSTILANNRGPIVHRKLSKWIRQRLLDVFDGDPALRCISTVEALLLLTEWPLAPKTSASGRTDGASEEARLLSPSLRYDASSWTNIGLAVRLGQELGLHHAISANRKAPATWREMRALKTWVYCYTADRHIAVRLGRNAVFQEAMSSRWWEATSSFVHSPHKREDVWTSDTWILGAIAQLMGTIQDHLYTNKDMTRSLLRSGAWEPFLRSLRLEIRYSKRATARQLRDGSLSSALLQIELDYVVLYAYSLALRALQDKLRRRRQAGDVHYTAPSLLNLVEGPWIMEAASAARSIIETALNTLQARSMLRYCPSRIFQFILFATTFLYKALACGMVEEGQKKIAVMLDEIVSALSNESIDDEHFVKGFAELLRRLGKHWKSAANNSPSVLNVEPSLREENVNTETQAATPPAVGPAQGPAQAQQDTAPTQPQQDALPIPGLNGTPPNLLELGWNFNPVFQMPAADHEQDILFQTIWDTSLQDTDNETSNLYATLLGNALNVPDNAGL